MVANKGNLDSVAKGKDKGLVDRARWVTAVTSSVEAMEAEGAEGDGSPVVIYNRDCHLPQPRRLTDIMAFECKWNGNLLCSVSFGVELGHGAASGGWSCRVGTIGMRLVECCRHIHGWRQKETITSISKWKELRYPKRASDVVSRRCPSEELAVLAFWKFLVAKSRSSSPGPRPSSFLHPTLIPISWLQDPTTQSQWYVLLMMFGTSIRAFKSSFELGLELGSAVPPALYFFRLCQWSNYHLLACQLC